MSQINSNNIANKYKNTYIGNRKVEWLLNCGKIRESVFFRGAIGDRYSLYIATKRSKNTVDFHQVYHSYDYGTTLSGVPVATIKNNILTVKGNDWDRRYYSWGNCFKQLMRQGVNSKNHPWKVRWCRSAYFVKFADKTECTPWKGMKIDLNTGKLLNKPSKDAKKAYKVAQNQDKIQRKRNYVANKNNRDALARYKAAGGDTKHSRNSWMAKVGEGTENINWDMIPIDDIFKHRNTTFRTNILNHYGINRVLETLKYDVVDVDFLNGGEYRLLNVEIPELSRDLSRWNREVSEYKGLYLEMKNPSTGESHFEGIANVGDWGGPKEASVKAALAWRDNDAEMQGKGGNWNNSSSDDYIPPTTIT